MSAGTQLDMKKEESRILIDNKVEVQANACLPPKATRNTATMLKINARKSATTRFHPNQVQ